MTTKAKKKAKAKPAAVKKPEIPRVEMASPDQKQPCRIVRIELPEKLGFLLGMHRYKVAYGGRGAAKSHSFARAILALGAAQELRILCAREVMESIEKSVYQLLVDLIDELQLRDFYTVMQDRIVGGNGTEIIFCGLGNQTIDSIKSYEGVDICWVEEAQTVKKRSWDILIPTIRADNSEIWVSFNPDMDTDEAWVRFVERKPTGAVVVKVNYYDNPWFNKVLEQERIDAKRDAPKDYPNIWDGNPKVVVAGAIYADEVTQAITEQRIGRFPYDPRFPVHRFWDLGWNDAMTILMVQKVSPNSCNIINYLEDNRKRYDQFIGDMKHLGYNWGEDWLPHDGDDHDPKSGTSAKKILIGLGCRVQIMEKTGPEQRIKAGRLVFPRIYIDNAQHERTTGHLGGHRLVEVLKRYRRNVPKTTMEPTTPVHDEFSHGADAFGGFAENVERIRNDFTPKPITLLPVSESLDPTMGPLGN